MTNKLLRWCYTAIVTPFTADNKIDYKSLEKLVELQIEWKVSWIVFAWTTWESPTLSRQEHVEILNWSAEVVNWRCQVIAWTWSNSTEEALYYSHAAKKAWADAMMIVNPYYNKPTQEGLFLHFSKIASEISMPMIIYNIKWRTWTNVETPTLLRLAKIDNIVAVKEASWDISQIMDVISQTPDNFSCLSWDDELTLPLIALWGDWVISVASNYLPSKVSELVNLCLSWDFVRGKELHYKLIKIFKDWFLETNPIPAKEILWLMWLIHVNFRLPICRSSGGTLEKLKKTVEEIRCL